MSRIVKKAYSFNDLCLIPKMSKIKSRMDVNISTRLTKKTKIDIPIVASNMESVMSYELAQKLIDLGTHPIYHRFSDLEDQLKFATQFEDKYYMSAGTKIENEKKRVEQLLPYARGVCYDVAHGHTLDMIEMIEWTKKNFPEKEVIAGNICTPEAVIDLSEAGADALKIGIGPGAACTTRKITGVGVPQLSSIMECYEISKEYDIPLISDGGIETSGDMSKAISAGASSVMIGKLFAQTIESVSNKVLYEKDNNNNIKEVNNEIIKFYLAGFIGNKVLERDNKQILYCKYRGQASKDFQKEYYGEMREGIAPEGESFYLPLKYMCRELIKELTGGLRSSMSMQGAESIEKLHEIAEFREVLQGYTVESSVRN
jgi:IMP dehydrogenase